MRFLDTNLFIRHFTYDDPDQSPRATALLARVEQGEEIVVTSPLVVFEVVFTLERQYRLAKEDVAKIMLPFIRLRNLRLEHKQLFRQAFDLHTTYDLGLADAYNAVYMQSLGVFEIYSFDDDFDKVPGVARVEP